MEKLRKQYPDKVPVIIQRDCLCRDVPELFRKRVFVSKSMLVSHLLYYVRRQLQMPAHRSIYLYVNESLPMLTQTVGMLHHEEAEEDGILYVFFATEHVFGNELLQELVSL